MTPRRTLYLMVLLVLLAGCTGGTRRALPSPAPTSAPAAIAPEPVASAAPTTAPPAAPEPTDTASTSLPAPAAPGPTSTAALAAAPGPSQGGAGGTATASENSSRATDAPLAALAGATPPDDPGAAEAGPGEGASASPTAAVRPSATLTSTPSPAALQVATPGAQAGGSRTPAPTSTAIPAGQHPLAIPVERQRAYPGSEIAFEQTLAPGANYARYIVSYHSDGLKIYALMTVPNGPKPASGWPVVIFNHGSIPPAQYVTTERYVAYQDAFARAGYISFKSDYRGHGKSEGLARGPFSSADYTADVLNALASLKNYKDADAQRIGMWGHSMGGQITLRAMVISKDIKAGVIWSGTVASQVYELAHPRRPSTGPTATPGPFTGRGGRAQMLAQYGTPEQNPAFWSSISPNSYLADLSGPLQLHHGLADPTVPPVYSELLRAEVLAAGRQVELYTYPGDNHNISNSFNTAIARSVAFMDRFVKGN